MGTKSSFARVSVLWSLSRVVPSVTQVSLVFPDGNRPGLLAGSVFGSGKRAKTSGPAMR